MRAHHLLAIASLVATTTMCGGGGGGPTGPAAGSGAAAGAGAGTATGTDPYGGAATPADNGCTSVAPGTVCIGTDLSFTPVSLTVPHGTVVTFANGTGTVHNVTFDPVIGAPANVPDFATGTQSVTFSNAGTYPYHCTIHGVSMHGTVVVQ